MYLLYSGMGVGVLSGSAVVDTQLGGYQVVFVKSPHKKEFVNGFGSLSEIIAERLPYVDPIPQIWSPQLQEQVIESFSKLAGCIKFGVLGHLTIFHSFSSKSGVFLAGLLKLCIYILWKNHLIYS